MRTKPAEDLRQRLSSWRLGRIFRMESQPVDRLIPTRSCEKCEIDIQRTEACFCVQAENRCVGFRTGVTVQRISLSFRHSKQPSLLDGSANEGMSTMFRTDRILDTGGFQ